MAVVTDRSVERQPYGAYAAITGIFVGGLGVAGYAAHVLDRNLACQTALDFAVLSAASFKAARTLARNEVTSFMREPFSRVTRTKGTRIRSRRETSGRQSGSS
jgi:Protein of unknown function (DUF1360)